MMNGVDIYKFNGKDISLKSLYSSEEQKTQIDQQLTKYINERSKNDFSDILIKQNIEQVLSDGLNKIKGIINPTIDQLDTLETTIDDLFEAIPLGDSDKSIAENEYYLAKAKNVLKSNIIGVQSSIAKKQLTDVTNNAKINVSQNLTNYDNLQNVINSVNPILKNDGDFIYC